MKRLGLTVRGSGTRAFVYAGCATALVACGGGGDDGGGVPASTVAVSSAVASGMYSQRALVTLTGNALDQGITVSSPTCTNIASSTTAPHISNATTAYYRCTTSGMGAHQVTVARTSDGATLASAAFTVPAPQVTLKVSNGSFLNGDVVITLAPDKTPITVDNFLAYVDAKFYDGTIFHRVVRDQLVQGGGYVPGVAGAAPVVKSTNAPIVLEVGKGLSNVPWSIGMARALAPDTATSQFYVNVVDNSVPLDPNLLSGSAGYAVFGVVESGRTLLAAMAANSCPAARECLPSVDVLVTSAVQTR